MTHVSRTCPVPGLFTIATSTDDREATRAIRAQSKGLPLRLAPLVCAVSPPPAMVRGTHVARPLLTPRRRGSVSRAASGQRRERLGEALPARRRPGAFRAPVAATRRRGRRRVAGAVPPTESHAKKEISRVGHVPSLVRTRARRRATLRLLAQDDRCGWRRERNRRLSPKHRDRSLPANRRPFGMTPLNRWVHNKHRSG